MGFNKRYLPEYDDLKEMVSRLGVEYVIKMYTGFKVDALIGSSKSFEYLKQLKKELK